MPSLRKAECPKRSGAASLNVRQEATTTIAEAIEDVANMAFPEGRMDAEVIQDPPSDAMSLAEAHLPAKLSISVQRTRRFRAEKHPRARLPTTLNRPFHKSPCPPTECASEAVKREQPRLVEQVPILMASGSFNRVLAILDTGASRCVMGADLLPKFLKQLSTQVRDKIRVTESRMKFRFGNNQTLTGQKRVLLPMQHPSCSLWLGVEVVPGATPLLFSKRAIKQLDGVIDTGKDTCFLRRLHCLLRLETGPTGLYMIDLARLCEESSHCHRNLGNAVPVGQTVRSESHVHVLQPAVPESPCSDLGSNKSVLKATEDDNSSFDPKPHHKPDLVNDNHASQVVNILPEAQPNVEQSCQAETRQDSCVSDVGKVP